jgi:hypothetical protein
MADSRTDRLLADYEVPVLTPAAHPDRVVRGPIGSAERPTRRAGVPAVLVTRAAVASALLDAIE